MSVLFIFHYIFLRLARQSLFIPLQNVVYFITLSFLVCKIFTFYINDVLLINVHFQRQGLNCFMEVVFEAVKLLHECALICVKTKSTAIFSKLNSPVKRRAVLDVSILNAFPPQ